MQDITYSASNFIEMLRKNPYLIYSFSKFYIINIKKQYMIWFYFLVQ